MILPRLIPVMMLRDSSLVLSRSFSTFQRVGNPFALADRYRDWDLDELIYLDITPAERRSDGTLGLSDVLPRVAHSLFAPLTAGGNLRSVDDIRALLSAGADRVVINSEAVRHPSLVGEAAAIFGSQAVVIAIDAASDGAGGYQVMIDHGRTPAGVDPAVWASKVEALGAGEILINSIDHDGNGRGYDLELVRRVVNAVNVPVIACGGCGRPIHVADVLGINGVSAAAAGNIFNFTELSYQALKRQVAALGHNVRKTAMEAGNG